MKKNLPSVSNGKTPAKRGSATNRPAARDITPTATRSASVSSVNSKSNSGKKSTGKKNGKKSNKVVPIVASVAGVILVCGVAAGCLYKKGFFEEKYPMTMADGTVVEMTADEIRKAIVRDTFCNGVSIDGIDVSGLTKEEATALIEQNAPEAPIDLDISLDLEGKTYPLDMSSLTLENNLPTVIDEAFALAKPEEGADINRLIEVYNQQQSLKTSAQTFQTAYTVNSDGLAPIVHAVLDPLQSEAQDAELLGFNLDTLSFDVKESSEGYAIDVDKAINDTKAMLDSRTYQGTVAVDAEITEPQIPTEFYTDSYGLVSEASSNTTSNNSRNHNIRITCEKIDGLVLMPGESFSFNGFVGIRNAETGYEQAGVILAGVLEQDYGGGICQVSSMIYQSVVKANLQVDERHPHQWPSTYATAGTDAAVDWPNQDFAFTNNSEYPVALHLVFDNDNYTITVQLYSHFLENNMTIDFIGETISSSAPGDPEYIPNPGMSVGSTNTVRSPHNRIVAKSYQVWYDADGNEVSRNEYATTTYNAITAQIEVGILCDDGSLAEFDSSTGEVTVPEPEETEPEPEPEPESFSDDYNGVDEDREGFAEGQQTSLF